MQLQTDGAWYFGSFFYGAGGKYETEWDDAELVSAKCNFNEMAVDVNGVPSDTYTIGQIGATAGIDVTQNKSAAGRIRQGNNSVIDQDV